jgi:hypothetical protein
MPSKSSVGSCLARDAGIRKFFTPLFLALFAGLVSAGTLFAAPVGTFRGGAYGTFANSEAGPVATTLGHSAFLPCPCDGTDGETLENHTGNVSAGNGGEVLIADETLSTGRTTSTASSSSMRFTSRVEGLNALNGLITAAAVTAVSKTDIDANSITGNTDDSRFGNLQIAGKKFSPTVSPNTRVKLPGIGFVVLNKVTENGNGKSSGKVTVHMIEINITQDNSFNLPVGAQIVVGHATSGFSRRPLPVIMVGAAYGAAGRSNLSTEQKNQIGRAAFISLPCDGTDGETRRNTAAALNAGSTLSFGSVHTASFGGRTAQGTKARTKASVDNVQLLGGLIVAGNVTAVAQETVTAAGTRTRSAEGSGYSALQVMGTSVPGTVPPNTKMQLPGIGYVVLNEQHFPVTSSDEPTQVTGMRIVVNKINVLGLPVGSEIVVAHALAGAKKVVPESAAQVVASGQ